MQARSSLNQIQSLHQQQQFSFSSTEAVYLGPDWCDAFPSERFSSYLCPVKYAPVLNFLRWSLFQRCTGSGPDTCQLP